jgi:hypothetical protein
MMAYLKDAAAAAAADDDDDDISMRHRFDIQRLW